MTLRKQYLENIETGTIVPIDVPFDEPFDIEQIQQNWADFRRKCGYDEPAFRFYDYEIGSPAHTMFLLKNSDRIQKEE